MYVRFSHKESITPDIVSLFFEPLEPFNYTAGQFIELNLKHDKPDSRGIRRWFTLASAPEDEYLQITTRYAGKNSSSFKKAFVNLSAGTQLSFSPPEGDFTLPKNPDTKLIFVAGGIGITPIHSMVKHLLITEQQRDVRIIHGINNLDESLFSDVFDAYQADVELVISKSSSKWQGATGYITAEQILAATTSQSNYLVYLSGPEPMIEKLNADLLSAGVPSKRIKTDFFPGYQTI